MTGYSLRVFVPEGDPDGVNIVRFTTRTTVVLKCSRAKLSDLANRPEFTMSGVYLLVGEDIETSSPRLYVGEGDDVGARIRSHATEKEFWRAIFVFVSAGESLNKAHTRYVEARLVDIARSAGRCVLDNATAPSLPPLAEDEVADMEAYLADLALICPMLGLDIFERAESDADDIFLLKYDDANASGRPIADGFVVFAGASLRCQPVNSAAPATLRLRAELVEAGVIKEGTNGSLTLEQDQEFSSPSSAANVLIGGHVNGRDVWKTSDGPSLKSVEASSLEAQPNC